MNRQEELVQELRSNEHIVQIVDSEELAFEWQNLRPGLELASDNTALVLDAAKAQRAIRELGGFVPGKVVIKRYAGKEYVIFKGSPKDRLILRGTRYLTSNPTVVRLAIGPKGRRVSERRIRYHRGPFRQRGSVRASHSGHINSA